MSVSPSNWQRDIQGIPRRACEHLHHPPPCPRRADKGGAASWRYTCFSALAGQLEGCLQLTFGQLTFPMPSFPEEETVSPKCTLQFAFHCPIKLYIIFFLVPQFPLHKHQFIHHWATRLWNASAWLNVTKICMSRAAPCSCCPAPLARAAVEAECGYQIHKAELFTKESTSWWAQRGTI